MPSINVLKGFKLTRDDGSVQEFYPGKQDVSDADAKHWYVQAHLDKAAVSTDAALQAKAEQDQFAIDAERQAQVAADPTIATPAASDADAKVAADAKAAADADAAKSSTKK